VIVAPPPPPARVQVVAQEFRFALSRTSIRHGWAVIELRNIGEDAIVAFATIDNATVMSNQVPMIWIGGRHTTYLTLNGSPTSGDSGGTIGVTATLLDRSVDPALPIPAADITFTMGAAQCDGTTNASGVATCDIALGAPGVLTLNANYAGTSALLPASATQAFHVLDDRIFADGFDGG